MFLRKKSPQQPEPQPPTDTPVGKGRPTPKRRDVEARNRRPLVPTDRATARRVNREAQLKLRERQRQAMFTGDERYLPERDKGPVRRWVRDYVDARWNLGEFFLPVALVVVIATLFFGANPAAAIYVILALYGVVFIAIIDAVLLARAVKRGLRERFSEDEIPSGTSMYAVMRAFQIRRARLPKPQVQRGEYPVGRRD